MKNHFTLLILFVGLINIFFSQTVTIGTQIWMTKNLEVSTFRNGDPIPEAKTVLEWLRLGENKQPAWCYYDNDPANGAKYGKLYNWYAVNDTRGLAPTGFHIPTSDEFIKLFDFLGKDSVAVKKLKNKIGWDNITTDATTKTCPNCATWSVEYRRKVPCHTCKDTRSVPGKPSVTRLGNGSNSSGFSAIPGGECFYMGVFAFKGTSAKWWTSTQCLPNGACFYGFNSGNYLMNSNTMKECGLSIRCIKD